MWTACNSCSTFFLSNKFLEFIRWRKVWHAYTFLYHNILHNAFDAIGNMFLEINPKTELCWSAQEQEGWLQHKYPRQNMQTWAELLYPTHFSSERNIWFARYTARAKHNKANSRKWLLAWFCFYNNCWDCWQLTSWRFIFWLLNMKSQSWFPTSAAQLGPVVALSIGNGVALSIASLFTIPHFHIGSLQYTCEHQTSVLVSFHPICAALLVIAQR